MAGTSDKAVIDYLDNLFLDETLPPTAHPLPWQDSDSIAHGSRIQLCNDVFALMAIKNPSAPQLWEGFLQLIVLGSQLPQGHVQSYVFKQCQVLYQKARDIMAG